MTKIITQIALLLFCLLNYKVEAQIITQPNLVITEVAHSPNTIEFIEVFNAGTTDADLNGLYWSDGTTGNFPDTILPPGGTILFSTDPLSASTLMGGNYYLLNNGLGANNDVLLIKDIDDNTLDSVSYFVGSNGWPAAPTGNYGYAFELNDATLDNENGLNWSVGQNIIASANGTILASPGQYPPPPLPAEPQLANFTQLTANTTQLVFNEMMDAVSVAELANYTFTPSLNIISATLDADGQTVLLSHDALTDGLPYELVVGATENAGSVANVADTLDLIWNSLNPALVITEIIHSPNTIEGIEVFNSGFSSIPLGGLRWTEGTNGNFPVMALNPGEVIYFSTDPVNASSILNISEVYPLGAGLGSGDDILVIKNSADATIDSVAYYVGTNGWPTAPSGLYAYAFELNEAVNDNNIGSNWTVPFNTVVPEPTQGVVRGTPGVYPAPIVAPGNAQVNFVGLNLSEEEGAVSLRVMANLVGGGALPSSVDVEILPIGTADAGIDFIAPVVMRFEWVANANNINDTLTFSIIDDALAESAEYFVLRMVNPVNVDLPAAAANHFTLFITDDDKLAPVANEELTLTHLTSFSNGTEGVNSAEIVAYDAAAQRLFIANSIGAKLDIIDFSDPAVPSLINSIVVTPYGNINSVASNNGIVATAIEDATDPQAPGKVVFFDVDGTFISQVTVGAMPDMITFNHAGTKVLTANEGEPNTAYTNDPEGSVSVIDISGGVIGLTQAQVTTISLTGFNGQEAALRASGIRIFGPNASVAQDLEPEYIAISDDDQTAWITCQENNALLVIDLSTNTVVNLLPMGTKDLSLPGNGFDANDQTTAIQIANWPVHGVFMPDATAYFTVGGTDYLMTANEGDAREWDGYSEVDRLNSSSFVLDTLAFPYPEVIKANLGRLNITFASGDADGDGLYEEIHAYGGRSVSIWNAATGALVWDSGDDMELMIAQHPVYSALFNASNANNGFKNRSDDKGPEPEGVTIASINDNIYAFIALERMGGCMVYNITNPLAPAFVTYVNTRNLLSYGGDQGSEGILYIPAASSPNGQSLVILANEVSSTLSIFGVTINTPTQIDMSSLTAVNEGKVNKLEWTTYKEDHGDKMIIERSADGATFKEIGEIAALGQSNAYVFSDKAPLLAANHYRVKLIYPDGGLAYSNTATAWVKDHPESWKAEVFPNPATDELQFSIRGAVEEAAILRLLDPSGRVFQVIQVNSNVTTLDVAPLPSGVYFLHYLDGDRSEVFKFSKQ